MSQELTSLIARIGQAFRIRPLDSPAERASGFEVRLDGGAFTLHAYDVRESAEIRPAGPNENWVSVEIGRFMISPQGLARLKESIAAAEAMYTAVVGSPLQTDAEYAARFNATINAQTPPPAPKQKR